MHTISCWRISNAELIDMLEFFHINVIPKPVTESIVGEYEDLEHVDMLKFYKGDSKRSSKA